MELTDLQIERYSRHLVLPEIGEEGQAQLLQSRVLVVGAGGLGSPLLMYLAAAGIGTLGVIDDDVVDLSNLQRQVLHDTLDVGSSKVESARRRLAGINPEVRVVTHHGRLSRDSVMGLIEGYDLVADGSDNFATRYLLSDACHFARKPLVSAAIMRFDGQISTFKPYLEGDYPCYRCVFSEQPPDSRESCADVGVLAMLPGTLGALQATEVVKELLGIGTSLSGKLLLYDALAAAFQVVRVRRDPACPLCGRNPTIRDISEVTYEHPQSACSA